MIGDRLGVIASRRRDHPARTLLRRQLQQFVKCPALLVGGGKLEVLELQPDFGTDNFRQGPADQHRGSDDRALNPLGRIADVVDGRSLKHSRHGLAVHSYANNAKPPPMHKSLLAIAAACLPSPAWSDTLVDNVNGIQAAPDGSIQHFRALVIGGDGKVRQVLEHPELVRLSGITQHVDGHGRTLLPGLIDAHGHVLGLGFGALQLDLVGTNSLEDLKQRLQAYAVAHPGARWIVGRGWNQELWPVKAFPTAADLDAVVGDRPVVLERVDGHALVANSTAMKMAGVTAATKTPPGGRIENGLFVDNAMDLVNKAIPPATPAELDQALAKAQDILLGYGVTGVGSMSTTLGAWEAMRRAGDAGRLQVRLMVYADGLDPLKVVPK